MWEIPPLLMVVLRGTQTYEFSRLYSCCGKLKSPLKAKPVEKEQHSMNSIHSSSDTKYVHLVYLDVDTVFLWGRMLSWPLVPPYRSSFHGYPWYKKAALIWAWNWKHYNDHSLSMSFVYSLAILLRFDGIFCTSRLTQQTNSNIILENITIYLIKKILFKYF